MQTDHLIPSFRPLEGQCCILRRIDLSITCTRLQDMVNRLTSTRSNSLGSFVYIKEVAYTMSSAMSSKKCKNIF